MEPASGLQRRPRVTRQSDVTGIDLHAHGDNPADASPKGVRACIGLYENLTKGSAYQVRRTQSDTGQRAPPARHVWERSVTFVDATDIRRSRPKLTRTPTPYWNEDDDEDEADCGNAQCLGSHGDPGDSSEGDKDKTAASEGTQRGCITDGNGEVIRSTTTMLQNCDLQSNPERGAASSDDNG